MTEHPPITNYICEYIPKGGSCNIEDEIIRSPGSHMSIHHMSKSLHY